MDLAGIEFVDLSDDRVLIAVQSPQAVAELQKLVAVYRGRTVPIALRVVPHKSSSIRLWYVQPSPQSVKQNKLFSANSPSSNAFQLPTFVSQA